jgi:hypothetical protein
LKRPEYLKLRDGLHPDVVRECEECWALISPWTPIRPLRKGVDTSAMASCAGVVGAKVECARPVTKVQYTTAFGDPQFYCDQCGKDQDEWDAIHYPAGIPTEDDDDDRKQEPAAA